jgi:TolA-binding protein
MSEAVQNEPLNKIENIWNKYQKQILMVAGALAIIIGGWYAYQNLIVAPKEAEAEEAMWKAESYFRQDSLKLALNGDKASKGFLSVINNYGGTKAGNLAKYYAGCCYLRTGDFNSAVKYLSGFSTNAKPVQMMADGALGDAYSELNKNDEAVASYKKAASEFTTDKSTSAEYLFRAALKLETTGKNSEALELYRKIKADFPQTQRGFEAAKYIYRLSPDEPNDLSVK